MMSILGVCSFACAHENKTLSYDFFRSVVDNREIQVLTTEILGVFVILYMSFILIISMPCKQRILGSFNYSVYYVILLIKVRRIYWPYSLQRTCIMIYFLVYSV